jgi:V-type H+-transporting ATPase subunit a
MDFTLCLQIPNHLRFKRPIKIYANFIPQALFFLSNFGYLAIRIVYKRSVNWSAASMRPPSLLNTIIAMFLSPGTIPADLKLYSGQALVQVVLLGFAGICVLWLLITKPYIEYKEIQKSKAQGYIGLGHGNNERARRDNDNLAGEEECNCHAIAEEMETEGVSGCNSFKQKRT